MPSPTLDADIPPRCLVLTQLIHARQLQPGHTWYRSTFPYGATRTQYHSGKNPTTSKAPMVYPMTAAIVSPMVITSNRFEYRSDGTVSPMMALALVWCEPVPDFV